MTTSCVFIVCVCIYYIHFIYWNQSDVITVYVLRLWIPAWARNPMKFFFHPHRTVQVLFLCQVISQVKLNTWLSGDESQRITKLCGLSRINSFHHNSHPGQNLWTGVFREHRDKLEPARVNMTQCFSEVKKHTMNRSLIKTYHGSQFIWDVSHTVISTDALIMGHCVYEWRYNSQWGTGGTSQRGRQCATMTKCCLVTSTELISLWQIGLRY